MLREDIAPLPGFNPEIGLLLASLQDSTREWRRYLGEPTTEAIVWQPAPDGHSIGGLLLHLIDVERYWLEEHVAGIAPDPDELKLLLSEETQQGKGIWPAPPAKPIQWYFELHENIRKRAWEAIRGFEPEAFFPDGDEVESSLRWIVSHVVQHDAYTGGQAVLLHEMWKKRQA
jgi:uncharacterized damage-inducible protein DinB